MAGNPEAPLGADPLTPEVAAELEAYYQRKGQVPEFVREALVYQAPADEESPDTAASG